MQVNSLNAENMSMIILWLKKIGPFPASVFASFLIEIGKIYIRTNNSDSVFRLIHILSGTSNMFDENNNNNINTNNNGKWYDVYIAVKSKIQHFSLSWLGHRLDI